MTVQEAKEALTSNIVLNSDLMFEALAVAVKSLEAWETVEKEVEEIINRPCITLMEHTLALREVRDIIKKHLGEVEEC